eukprot:symbB.v1.2.002280.t1/scaffold100.1/size330964/4
MEAELKHMRYENMRLRGILEEAGLGEKTKSVFGPGGSPQTPQVESKVTMDATTSCDDLETTEETFRPPHVTAATTGPDPRQVSVSTGTPTSTQWITMKTEGRSATSTPSTSTPTTPATDGFVKAGWNADNGCLSPGGDSFALASCSRSGSSSHSWSSANICGQGSYGKDTPGHASTVRLATCGGGSPFRVARGVAGEHRRCQVESEDGLPERIARSLDGLGGGDLQLAGLGCIDSKETSS